MTNVTPRKPDLKYSSISKYWLQENASASHVVNAVNLLFPAGERYFIRSVRKFLPQIKDETLRKNVKGFFGQESMHAKEHEKYFDILRGHGYKFERFLKFYEFIAYTILEKVFPAQLNLATTAAAEHYTALLAEAVLGEKRIFDESDQEMQNLLKWHAAEELEHKSVAFDVLKTINPSYALRMAGLASATFILFNFWVIGSAVLLIQDKEVSWSRFIREMKEIRGRFDISKEVLARGVRDYVQKDFHPDNLDNYHLATDFFKQVPSPS